MPLRHSSVLRLVLILLLGHASLLASQSFPRSDPEAQGVASTGVLDFVNKVESKKMNLHSVMLVRHGHVVAEGWWAPYAHDLRHTLYSLSKSFTSTAVGIAADEGKLSLDDKVISFFPQDVPATVSANLSEMRVKHLLMMGTGHKACALFGPGFSKPEGNWVQTVLSRPVEFEPGTHFVYNNGATFTLAAIVQKATGQTLLNYLNLHLFEPLGIENAEWELNPQGYNTGAWGLRVTTEDIAKLGQLYLKNGVWRGKRILSENWVREATKAQIKNAAGKDPAKDAASDWAQGYGFQFWRCRNDAFRGDGAFGQYCIVMPKQDAVVAITSETNDMQIILNAVWDHILPALKAERLPADNRASDELKAKLASLSLPFPSGQPSSPQAARVNKRTFSIAENTLGVRSISLDFSSDTCTFTMLDTQAEHKIECGLGKWKRGETDISPAPLHLATTKTFSRSPVACAGAWSDENTFVMHWRFVETAHYQSVTCRFTGDEIQVEFKKSAALLNPSGKDGRPVLNGRVVGK
ncbi:MAG TPA: serine hydrolase [Planctomycetota bacterium]|jgi:CubicO group peptidase (beta-lactamase class C family)